VELICFARREYQGVRLELELQSLMAALRDHSNLKYTATLLRVAFE